MTPELKAALKEMLAKLDEYSSYIDDELKFNRVGRELRQSITKVSDELDKEEE